MAKKRKFNLKWNLIWIIIHTISLFIISFITRYFILENNLIRLLFIGIGVTILAKIGKIFTAKRKFVVDKWFIFWLVLNSFTIWLFGILLNAFNITNSLLAFLVTAFGLVLVAFVVRRFRITKFLWSTVIILLLLLFFLQNSLTQSIVVSSSSVTNEGSGNLFDSIKDTFSKISFNNCPQLDYPMIQYGTDFDLSQNFLDIRQHEGWTIKAYRSPRILCYKGNEKGENPNYWYCGEPEVSYAENADYALIEKTETNSDGTIGETVRKSFYNVYDEDKNFIKTVCGKDPDKLMEDALKGELDALDDFLN